MIKMLNERDDEHETIYSTIPAHPGNFLIYVQKDGTVLKTTIIAWGVVERGVIVPLTLSGAWDGVSNKNMAVLHADGSVGRFEEDWPDLDTAVAELRKQNV